MSLNWIANILVHHPYMILMSITVFSGSCLIIPLSLKIYPNFSDPQMGFETRGTYIAKRQTAWKNLLEASRPSGPFVSNPNEWIVEQNLTWVKKTKKKTKKKPKIFVVESKNKNHSNSNWNQLQNMLNGNKPKTDINAFRKFFTEGYFCGPPDDKYMHIVVKAKDGSDLFNINSLLKLCKLEEKFRQMSYYNKSCVMTTLSKRCCKPWSLGNYIALLSRKSSCMLLTEEDIENTKNLLKDCSQYYYEFKLTGDCSLNRICEAPLKCIDNDAVFNILNFLASTSFLPSNKSSNMNLQETMIFFPLACSTAGLPYYHELENLELDHDNISVIAMEMGLKYELFNEYLIKDTWFMVMSGVFVLLCMWLYTKSLFLTVMTIIVIIFSLSISYFLYTLVFELRFFPFMNLLAIVVAIGIGADDTFIFCKIWQLTKSETNDISLLKVMAGTIRHAYSSMFVTSATTSAAFLASSISSITAVRCFSVFASMAVLANCFLMMTWFPASVILWERYRRIKLSLLQGRLRNCKVRLCCNYWNLILTTFRIRIDYFCKICERRQYLLVDSIVKFRYIWFTLFSLLACGSAIIVFYKPKLNLPNTPEFQLFHTKHPFEQYDLKYKDMFWFSRVLENKEYDGYYNLPLRFIWGVLPEDNGNYLNPQSLGTLVLDPLFDISEPESQKWLLNFCQNLRNQSFYQPTLGPLLSNCFIESFIAWMDRRCINPITRIDRSPCCESQKFPFKSSVFNLCIVEAISNLYETPSDYFLPGVAGPRFSKADFPTISVIVIEYNSKFAHSMSYEYMQNFVTQVENWMTKELVNAPKSMKNGWFVSDLSLYDLQHILSQSTLIAIFISMALALIVLLLSTLNVFISLYAITTITFSILVTVAVLVLLGWKLNILESIALSTAIGLSVDFCLHYAVHYRICADSLSETRHMATKLALQKMLGPSSMAALTTGAAGAFMLPSLILPYIQIGIFLVTVMVISWLYATFHFGATLAIFGPEKQFGQFYYSHIFFCFKSKKDTADSKRNNANPAQTSDAHELESLTNKTGSNTNAIESQQHVENSYNYRHNNCNRNVSEQSPSATSAVTIIMVDET